MHRGLLTLVVLTALSHACGGGSPPAPQPPVKASSLREAADGAGKSVGAAVSYNSLTTETDYADTLAREFNQMTCENEMKFSNIHPGQSTYSFSRSDAMVSFAQAHSMKVRGHTLVWHNQNPSWLTGGSYSPAQLSDILKDHINTVVGHYAGEAYAWDVVNEAFQGDGSLRSTIWYDRPGIGFAAQGTAYIEQAFKWSRAADPNALLFYNDFGAEGLNTKSDAIYNMVSDFFARGVPIDGVGLQMHLTESGISVSELAANIQRLTNLGLKVQVTELDVRLDLRNGPPTQQQLDNQARIYHDVAAACVTNPGCTAVSLWGFTDKHSWIPGAFPGFGAALTLDENYQPKPAYHSLLEAFLGN